MVLSLRLIGAAGASLFAALLAGILLFPERVQSTMVGFAVDRVERICALCCRRGKRMGRQH